MSPRSLFATGHNDAAERERLRARVAVAERRVLEYGGPGYAVALDMAQRALAVFERAHPAGGQDPTPGEPPSPRHLSSESA